MFFPFLLMGFATGAPFLVEQGRLLHAQHDYKLPYQELFSQIFLFSFSDARPWL
jgi:hypothetical protein